MKYVVLIFALMLSACASVPVDRKFPKAPEEIQTPCGDLQTIDPSTTKLSTVIDSVVTNYGQYRECQIKTDLWIQWYNDQKKIFDSVK